MAGSKPIEALKLASSMVTQLATVCSGLLTFTVTFSGSFKPASASVLSVPTSLKWSWLGLLVTILFSFLTLGGIVGTMRELEEGKDTNPGRLNIVVPALVASITFVAALALMVSAGWQATR